MVGVMVDRDPRWPLSKQVSLGDKVKEGARRVLVGRADAYGDRDVPP